MYDCIIIGAGPGGVVCAKELMENGIENIVCLEKAPHLGGTFAKSYDELTLTTSAVMSMFSDFWIGDDQTYEVWHKSKAVEYWKRYADHFGVTPKIRFNEEVVSVTSNPDGTWQVETASGAQMQARRMAIAAGLNSVARYPDWRGDVTSPDVNVMHSQQYKNAEPFRNKRVLVVGGGESGTDIALEISKVASVCWVSLRTTTGWLTPRKRGEVPADIATHRGVWGLPRSYGPEFTRGLTNLELARDNPVSDAAALLNKKVTNRLGVFGTYGTKSFSLPIAIAEHGAKLVGEIVDIGAAGRQLKTRDGQSLDDVDAIVFCTGYTSRNRFMPEDLQQLQPRSLYKHMIHPDLGLRACWFGMARANFGSQFPIMEMQARYFAQLCKGGLQLPSRQEIFAIIRQDKEQFENQFEHHARTIGSLVDYPAYLSAMAGLLGCEPPYWRYFLFRNKIWRTMIYGAWQGTQYRLRGLGAKPKLAREILRKCPSLPLSDKRVQLGLKGRVTCLWRRLIKGAAHTSLTPANAEPIAASVPVKNLR